MLQKKFNTAAGLLLLFFASLWYLLTSSGYSEIWLAALPLAIVGGVISFLYPPLICFGLLVLSFGLIPFVEIDFRIFSEMAVYATTLLVLVKSIKDARHFDLLRPFRVPLVIFAAAWLLALALGVGKGYEFANADARRYAGLLAIFAFSLIEYNKPGICKRLIIIASVVAAVMLIVQMATGWRVFGGFSGYWESVSDELLDITRGTARGGDYLIVFSLFYCVLNLSNGKRLSDNFVYLVGVALFLSAIVATFSRGLWAGVTAGAISLFWLYRHDFRALKRLFWGGLIGGVSFSSVLFVLSPRTLDAVWIRISSVKEEGAQGTSLGARFDENEQAIEAAKEYWLFGMGHGAEYKKYLNMFDVDFVNQITFIHNAYLWVLVKLGVLGIVAIFLFVYNASVEYKRTIISRGNNGMVGSASMAMIVAFLVTGLTSPVWGQFSDLVAFTIILIALLSASRNSTGKVR